MGREYPNPLEKGMRFNFSSPLGMGRETVKYMGVGDGEGKTRPHPAPLSCLLTPSYILSSSLSPTINLLLFLVFVFLHFGVKRDQSRGEKRHI